MLPRTVLVVTLQCVAQTIPDGIVRRHLRQIFRDNAAPSSNPMGIRIDSKRRKKLGIGQDTYELVTIR